MKLKKKTGIMMAAASAVAVVGIAAVSFAAWSGSANLSLNASAATGDIYTVGFANTNLDLGDKGLVPYNQPDGSYNAEENTTVISVALPEIKTYEAFTITVTAYSTLDLENANNNVQTALPLYAIISENKITSVTSSTDLTDWSALSGENAKCEYEYTEDTYDATQPITRYLNLVLNSENLNNNNTPFTILVELAFESSNN